MPDGDPRPRFVEVAAGLALAGLVGLAAILAAWWSGVQVGVSSPAMFLIAVALQTIVMLAALVPMAVLRGRDAGPALGLRPPASPKAYLWLPVIFVAAMIGHALVIALQKLTGRAAETPGAALLDSVAGQPGGLAALVVAAVLLAPLGEELLFRGLLFGWLRRHLAFALAAPLQAIPFGLVHGTLDYALYATLVGLVLALARERTGSLWVCIASHLFVNAGGVLFVYLGTVAIDAGSPGP